MPNWNQSLHILSYYPKKSAINLIFLVKNTSVIFWMRQKKSFRYSQMGTLTIFVILVKLKNHVHPATNMKNGLRSILVNQYDEKIHSKRIVLDAPESHRKLYTARNQGLVDKCVTHAATLITDGAKRIKQIVIVCHQKNA
jgi:hypothetical protein